MRCPPSRTSASSWRRVVRGAELHLPAGTAGADGDPLVVTPESAGWELCSLRVVRLEAGAPRTILTGRDELAVLPLSGGSASVDLDGRRVGLAGRESVLARVSVWAYVP